MSVIREREFDCVACGRHIIRFAAAEGEPALCAECLTVPNWFDDPVIQKMIDPEWRAKTA